MNRKKIMIGVGSVLALWLLLIVIPRVVPYTPNCPTDTSIDGINKIQVLKSERKLHLMENDQIVHSFDIDLSAKPIGNKRFEGDMKTPTGCYRVKERNDASVAYLSLRVSYPDFWDRVYGWLHFLKPGGDIMIHGLMTDTEHETYKQFQSGEIKPGMDWTWGCVAMRSNEDMQKVWDLTVIGTPIEIRE